MMRPMRVRAVPRFPSTAVLIAVLAACGSADAGRQPATAAGSPLTHSGAQDCGVSYYKHLPHNPGAADDHAYEAEEYVGLRLEEAKDRAEVAGLTVRILGTDGDCADRTDDLRSDRVNFYVEQQTVRAAARF